MFAALEQKPRPNSANICLEDFCQQWTINRRISVSNKLYGIFAGSVTFSHRYDETRQYFESGTLHLFNAARLAASRIYIWDHNLRVSFVDGRFFHQIFADGREIQYECGLDRYRGRYNFDAWPIWEVTWTVSGPQKNYQLSTVYRPQNTCSGSIMRHELTVGQKINRDPTFTEGHER